MRRNKSKKRSVAGKNLFVSLLLLTSFAKREVANRNVAAGTIIQHCNYIQESYSCADCVCFSTMTPHFRISLQDSGHGTES